MSTQVESKTLVILKKNVLCTLFITKVTTSVDLI